MMSPKTQWLSLVSGCLLLIYGLVRLFRANEWSLLIISILIIAFTLSSMARKGGGEE